MGLAVFTATIPLLGFPGVVKDGLTVIVGLAIVAIMYWGEKHAKFCPECNVPGEPHDHGKNEQSSFPRTEDALASAPQSPPSTPEPISSDKAPRARYTGAEQRDIVSHVDSSPYPFSFDAEKAKAQRNKERVGRRRTVVSG